MKKHMILASVVMSMSYVVYAAEEDPVRAAYERSPEYQAALAKAKAINDKRYGKHEKPVTDATALASARAKGIGVTALINRLPEISPRTVAPSSPATSDVGWDEKAQPKPKLGETLKTTRDIGRVPPSILEAAMGRPSAESFVPTTIHVLPAAISATQTLKLPPVVKQAALAHMPPAKKAIDPNAIVAQKYAKKAQKKAIAATAVTHPTETADIDATTVVNVAKSDELDVDALLDTEVELHVPSDQQAHNMTHIQHIVGGSARLYEKPDWGIYPRES